MYKKNVLARHHVHLKTYSYSFIHGQKWSNGSWVNKTFPSVNRKDKNHPSTRNTDISKYTGLQVIM